MNDKLIIFDTTLRDGEQSAGASMNREEKLKIALQLEQLRVDVIEAGFPVSSRGDFAAVKAIAETIRESTVCALARANVKDIEAAGQSLAPARRKRLHTFIATSPIHMRRKLQMSPQEVLDAAVAAVKLARTYTDDVEFSPEDAGRSEEDFLCRVLEAVIDAGATTVNIPDTVGYNMPAQFGNLIRRLRERVPNAGRAVFSVHCHNDLGVAVANSLAAVAEGARQVEGTINGIGERAGNTALEEVIMAVRTRRDFFSCDTTIDTKQLLRASRLVSAVTGFAVQPNKAIVGVNAFAHESGIHQDGVLKDKETYEIMAAEDVGWQSNTIRLGKLSGRNAFKTRLAELGFHFADDAQLQSAFAKFKELADKKRDIFDEDLLTIADGGAASEGGGWQLHDYQFTSESGGKPRAKLTLAKNNKVQSAECEGDGMIDAAFGAIGKIAAEAKDAELVLYSVRGITGGSDAQGEVSVRLRKDGMDATGAGSDTDIVVASVKAYLNALARLTAVAKAGARMHPQKTGAAV
ncbi:MAG: 2-isopropylmalate synthase [Gammaproteobacteria bacterium]